jgi:hypothetical protein
MRLLLHLGAFWLMWSLRAVLLRRSLWRVALQLIKLAAVVDVMKWKLRIRLPSSTPNQFIFAPALTMLERMLT